MKIAVTGAFSYSGKYITKRLLACGEEVITLTGHPNRPDPFNGKVKTYPLDFDEPSMTRSLQGVDVLVNTYWVRFDKGENTQPRAVENTRKLVNAATAAGVKRMIHISITNPFAESHLPYFWGKAVNEKAVMESGISYAIVQRNGTTDRRKDRCETAAVLCPAAFGIPRRTILEPLRRRCDPHARRSGRADGGLVGLKRAPAW